MAYPKQSEEYQKYFAEGADAFGDGRAERPPYIKDAGNTRDDLDKTHSWYDGYRAARAQFIEKKYHIEAFHQEIKNIIQKYGLNLDYEDEYGYPFCTTPEGYVVNLV